jgi:hypothetical protein
MATTTPNFGWAVPTSTDLVKDGAVAIETLGDSIDASLVDLKGGTTGQVLAKATGTDMDFTWVAQDDSNAIQNAIVDAKGDLIAATANDTPARLAVGTDNYFLQAASGQATGLQWGGTYTAYTPTLTNLTIGNGTLSAKYLRVGKMCHVEISVVFGSTTSITGAGPQITVPFNAAVLGNYHYAANTTFQDSGTANTIGGAVFVSVNSLYLVALLTNGTYMAESAVTATVPFTWTTNDRITISHVYEVA